MVRQLFTISSVISLLIFLAVSALWVRSKAARDHLDICHIPASADLDDPIGRGCAYCVTFESCDGNFLFLRFRPSGLRIPGPLYEQRPHVDERLVWRVLHSTYPWSRIDSGSQPGMAYDKGPIWAALARHGFVALSDADDYGFDFVQGDLHSGRWCWIEHYFGCLYCAPAWAVSLASLVLPWLWVYTRLLPLLIQHRRRRRGRCPVCGYDLRATPSRCSECGAAPTGL